MCKIYLKLEVHKYCIQIYCTSSSKSLFQSGMMKYFTPSIAPSRRHPLTNKISRITYGNVAVKYTTWNNNKNGSTFENYYHSKKKTTTTKNYCLENVKWSFLRRNEKSNTLLFPIIYGIKIIVYEVYTVFVYYCDMRYTIHNGCTMIIFIHYLSWGFDTFDETGYYNHPRQEKAQGQLPDRGSHMLGLDTRGFLYHCLSVKI